MEIKVFSAKCPNCHDNLEVQVIQENKKTCDRCKFRRTDIKLMPCINCNVRPLGNYWEANDGHL